MIGGYIVSELDEEKISLQKHESRLMVNEYLDDEHFCKKIKRMSEAGFKNIGNYIFYNETGRWLTNIAEGTMEEYAKRLPTFFEQHISEGMELAIGKAVPSENGITNEGAFGLYCTNWKELLQDQEANKSGRIK